MDNNSFDPILHWILNNETTETPVSDELLSYLLNDQEKSNSSFKAILPNNNIVPIQKYPQLLGKRKNGHSSPSEEDDNDDPTEDQLKLLPSKERKQLRNKISARNFRNRRKEYMSSLEERMDTCQSENSQLKLEVQWVRGMMDKLQAENDQLRLELALCKGGIQQPASIPTVSVSPPPTLSHPVDWGLVFPTSVPTTTITTTTSTHSLSPSSYPSASSLISTSKNNNNNSSSSSSSNSNINININTANPDIYLAHVTAPNWDLSSLFRKEAASTVNLIHSYPLLAPALMSMVIQHTMTMSTEDIIANSKFTDPAMPCSHVIASYQPPSQDKLVTALSDSALWQTIINTKPDKSDGIQEPQEAQTTTTTTTTELKLTQMKAYMQNHCPLKWFQKQFCIFILFYIVVHYPRLDKPCRTYLPICDKFRIKRQMATGLK